MKAVHAHVNEISSNFKHFFFLSRDSYTTYLYLILLYCPRTASQTNIIDRQQSTTTPNCQLSPSNYNNYNNKQQGLQTQPKKIHCFSSIYTHKIHIHHHLLVIISIVIIIIIITIMELRKTEETIDNLISIYESIRLSTVWTSEQSELLLPIPTIPDFTAICNNSSTNACTANGGDNDSSPSTRIIVDSPHPPSTALSKPKPLVKSSSCPNNDLFIISDLESLAKTLQSLRETLDYENITTNNSNNNNDLHIKMQRFQHRLMEVDLITQKPRYGPQTQIRVHRMLVKYTFLCQQFSIQPPPPLSSSSITITTTTTPSPNNTNTPNDTTTTTAVATLFQHIQQLYQQEQQKREQEEYQVKLQQQQEQQQEEQNQQQQQEAQKRQQMAMTIEQQMAQQTAQQQQEERLRQQAEAIRQQRQEQQQQQRRAQQDYVDSIIKGVEGVRKYIVLLQQSTEQDLPAQRLALQRLATIFEQIYKHPEETQFRKVRINHPAFHQDIGRHRGCIELLIAAGFRPTMLSVKNDTNGSTSNNNNIDDNNNNDDNDTPSSMVACLVSKEPNLETDMDGWTEWYDLNKATYEILQKVVISGE